ncbi:hypothetical protein DFH09DRAFT_1328011 [Mycena vulgaris]|nr:hypothetical protein DFH09DRAFT_1328011 [Mycena vulgaris]
MEILKRSAVDDTFGMLYISTVITTGLWGAGTVQLYYYYDRYARKDPRILRAFVAVVWFIDTVHQALLIWFVYEYLVTHYGEPTYLGHLHPALGWSVLCSGTVCYLVQLFFVRRLWQLSGNSYVLTGALGLAASAQYGCQMAYFGLTLTFSDFHGLTEILFLTKAINIITAITDTALAGALVYLLNSSRTGYARTQNIINRLIVFCVNTGAATGLSAILVLAFSYALPDKLVYMFFYMNIARLYVNSLLAALNYREALKNGSSRGENSNDGTHSSGNISMGRLGNRTGAPGLTSHVVNIHVNQEVSSDVEKAKSSSASPISHLRLK